MLLMIDNYDSFTYNLVQMLREQDVEVRVLRNDETTVDEIAELAPEAIVISPGPGTPDRAGVSIPVIERFTGEIPILGVCLGHQAIAAAHGAPIVGAQRIVHGKVEPVAHDGHGVFCGIPTPVSVTRYHSLAVREDDVPEGFVVTARSDDGEVMGIRHSVHAVEGIQFHPESIGSEHGARMLRNFVIGAREPVPLTSLLSRLSAREPLGELDANRLMSHLMEGHMTPAQIGAFLMSIRMKGETLNEIVGFARAIRARARRMPNPGETVDTCGTGGDASGTFNISTTAALVAAGAGARIAKHGNRSVTSKCGSADVLDALGVPLDLPPDRVVPCIDAAGIAFLFAPAFHQAMRHAAVPRRELGLRTVFNMLGPLCNPAGSRHQLMGVFDADLTETMAKALHRLGSKHALVVHGSDGLDEITLTGTTRVTEVRGGWFTTYDLDPREYGFKLCRIEDLAGGDPDDNRRILEEILAGASGPKRDVTLLNAAAVLVAADLATDLRDGLLRASEAIDSGAARRVLDTLASFDRAATAESP